MAHTAGRWSDGNRQVARAREVLAGAPDEATAAAVDVTAAYLALDTPGPDRTQHAEKLARSAADTAERHGLPVVACQARELLATVARERDPEESADMLRQALETAERHRLPLQRMYAATRMSGNAWLAEGDTSGLLAAREEALRLGSVNIVHTVDGILVLDAVLRGDHAAARSAAADCLSVARRLRLAPVVRYVLMAQATLEAHRADRPAMEASLAAFTEWDGAGSQEEPLSLGLARAFCALLEEDRDLARAELRAVQSMEAGNPSTYHLGGTHGLVLLLDVLAGDADRSRHEETTATAMARMRWNRQFVLLADAVLLGREGAGPRAAAAAESALAAAEPYPLARHLGLRLIADAAHRDGWGDAVGWLRQAEHFFHEREVVAVTDACRAALRRLGAPVHQHRSGTRSIPGDLRAQGVTVREFERVPAAGGAAQQQGHRRPAVHLAPHGGETHREPDHQDGTRPTARTCARGRPPERVSPGRGRAVTASRAPPWTPGPPVRSRRAMPPPPNRADTSRPASTPHTIRDRGATAYPRTMSTETTRLSTSCGMFRWIQLSPNTPWNPMAKPMARTVATTTGVLCTRPRTAMPAPSQPARAATSRPTLGRPPRAPPASVPSTAPAARSRERPERGRTAAQHLVGEGDEADRKGTA